jgi:hypothetical protein
LSLLAKCWGKIFLDRLIGVRETTTDSLARGRSVLSQKDPL